MRSRIARQIEEIDRLSRLRHELIGNVSHDLRTPLASLQGYLETLSIKGGSLPSERRGEYLEIALRQCRRLSQLVDELFELTRLDAPDTRPQREVFSLGELVQDNVQRVHLQATAKNVEVQADPGPLPLVDADIGLIDRVLTNLLDNAVRHTPPGGRVAVGLSAVEGAVTVSVQDDGRGIEPDELSRVFDRFYRGAGAAPSGAGLGLSISQRILELHGSRIDVESQPGLGARFSFSLPVCEGPPVGKTTSGVVREDAVVASGDAH